MKEKKYSNKQKTQVVERVTKKRYSVLTFVLLICIVELGYGTFKQFNKNIHHLSDIKKLQKSLDEQKAKNDYLKSQIKNFDSDAVLEAKTRNNLKMAEDNEILVMIHNPLNNIDY